MSESTLDLSRRRDTLASLAAAEIERRIVAGDLLPGEKLNEKLLAEALGVSRGTIREGIRALSLSGLVELVANRGAVVRAVSDEEIASLYELRGAIFAMACAGAARAVAADDAGSLVADLEANMAAMDDAYGDDDKAAYYRLNIAFHALVLDGAKNPRARAIYDSLVREMHLFRRKGLSIALNIARSIEEHRAIVDAIAAGDSVAAHAAGARHIARGQNRFRDIIIGETCAEEVSA